MSTAKFESAQALFCAIADFVGKDNIDKVLNMTEYPTYEKFEGGTKRNITNRFRIDEAAAFIDTTSNRSALYSDQSLAVIFLTMGFFIFSHMVFILAKRFVISLKLLPCNLCHSSINSSKRLLSSGAISHSFKL